MEQRLDYQKVSSGAFRAMLGMENHVRQCGLEHSLLELVKTRASQINGCAYCINMHTRDAIKLGETTQRLFVLDAWRETQLYTEKERAALALTEAMTLIAGKEVPDDIYDNAASLFTEQELAAIIMTIVTINAWNRISITSRTPLD